MWTISCVRTLSLQRQSLCGRKGVLSLDACSLDRILDDFQVLLRLLLRAKTTSRPSLLSLPPLIALHLHHPLTLSDHPIHPSVSRICNTQVSSRPTAPCFATWLSRQHQTCPAWSLRRGCVNWTKGHLLSKLKSCMRLCFSIAVPTSFLGRRYSITNTIC